MFKPRTRFLTGILTLVFFAWLLPLGAFIRPAQEGTACGGKRAMHMCSMGMARAPKTQKPPAGVSVTAPGGFYSGAKSPGSAGNDLLSQIRLNPFFDQGGRLSPSAPLPSFQEFPQSVFRPPAFQPLF